MMESTDPVTRDSGVVSQLRRLFGDLPESMWTERIVDDAMWEAALLAPARDILSRNGKGVRGRLLERSWQLAGGDPRELPELLPLTIELLHVGSLVIDDIEDDSRTRRGEPTLHRRYGLPLALNTGNWLYFLAYGLVSKLPLSDQIRLALYEDMSLGLLRCHQGQALDLSVRITEVPRARVPDIVRATTRLKTGALMRLAATLGARAAGGAPACVSVIGEYGTELGVGLQMLDDWSGLSVEERRDKGLEDLRLARPTWPWAWLAESADEFRYAELNREARRASIEWEVARVRSVLSETLAPVARERVRGQLGSTISVLRSGLGDVEGLSEVRDELEALERAYN